MNGQSADEMTKTEFPPSMISRPVYGVLEPRAGAFHLIVADGEGAEAVAEMVTKAADPAAMLAKSHILYTAGPNGTDQWDKIEALGAKQAQKAASIPTLLFRLARVLQDAPMGAQVVELGVINATIHKVNESVCIADIDQLHKMYCGMLERLIAPSSENS